VSRVARPPTAMEAGQLVTERRAGSPPVRTAGRPAGVVRIDDMADLTTPMAIRVAASLRLADHIAGGVATVPELAQRTGTHPAALGALIGHLVAVGVFDEESDGGLSLTRLGKQLQLAQNFLGLEDSVGRSELALTRLLDTVRSGRPGYPLVFGRTFWEDLVSKREVKASFDAMTDRHLRDEIDPLLAAYDWGAVTHLTDLGGGNGGLMIRILSAFDHIRGTIMELPGNADIVRDNLRAAGMADRCAVVPGSFLEPIAQLPQSTFVLASVLHDWADAEAVSIMQRCAEGLHPSENVLVIDSLSDGSRVDTRMDLLMLAMFGGRQRAMADMRQLASRAGLHLTGSRQLRKKWLLEFTSAPVSTGDGDRQPVSRVRPAPAPAAGTVVAGQRSSGD
jgi:2,7-dihydroxy-5-methyl-1-naphthoate 7-O-methyltransferase